MLPANAGIVDWLTTMALMRWFGVRRLRCGCIDTLSLAYFGVMRRYFEILFDVEKRRYSNIALRFPNVIIQNPCNNRGFGYVSLAGYAPERVHVRPYVRKDSPLGRLNF